MASIAPKRQSQPTTHQPRTETVQPNHSVIQHQDMFPPETEPTPEVPSPLPVCDLCRRSPHLPNSLLCGPCQETVGRVIQVSKWEFERGPDVRRNAAQQEMFLAYAKLIATKK